MPIQLIGRTTDFCGKPIWEILANLKNHGKGRIVIRHRFQRYPEPCFFKIVKVGALPVEEKTDRKCLVLVEATFRGKKNQKITQLDSSTYKPDFRLVPKDEEHKYLKSVKREEVILSRTMELPPLLREIMIRNITAKGETIDKPPEMIVKYNRYGSKVSRVAEEGEEPTLKPRIDLGIPVSPELYADVKPI